jgi:glucose/arabinose dehydrogenase
MSKAPQVGGAPGTYTREVKSTLCKRFSLRLPRAAHAAISLLLATSFVSPALAQSPQVPDGFVLETVVAGLSAAVDFTFAADGRIFVVEKAGRVRIVDDGVLLERPFIDLSQEVNDLGDRGLVGIALHPRFPETPYVYLSYAYDPPETWALTGNAGPNGEGTRVSRLIRVEADAAEGHAVALPGSEVVLLGRNSTFSNMGDPAVRNPAEPSCGNVGAYVQDCLPADEHSHTIGRVRFGPDGALYVSSGDGADYHTTQPYHVRAQDLDSLAGKLLRIDPETGEGLADNPFWDGDPNSNRSRVLNHGLRNPYSFTFNPETWEPIMGDVGWATWEEVNVGRGRNFGWPCYEGADLGTLEQPSFRTMPTCAALYADAEAHITPPVYTYNRAGVGAAIIVGDIATGDAIPPAFRDRVFVADYYQLWIRTLSLDDVRNPDATAADVVAEPFATVNFPVHVAVGPDGHIYYVNVWEGKLERIRYEAPAGNRPPSARSRTDAVRGAGPLVVTFDATGSSDPDGDALTYTWDFAGASSATGARVEATFLAGAHEVTLTVTDPSGMTDVDTTVVYVDVAGPTAAMASPTEGTLLRVGDVVTYAGGGVDARGLPLADERLRWQLRVRTPDGVERDALPPNASGRTGAFYVADHGEGATWTLCLDVVDDAGVPDRTCREMRTLR